MAFSGNVPIEAVVSRGVSGVGPVLHVPPNGASVGAEGELRIRQVAVEGQAPQSAPAMVSQLDQGGQVHYVGVRCGGDHEPYVIRDFEVITGYSPHELPHELRRSNCRVTRAVSPGSHFLNDM